MRTARTTVILDERLLRRAKSLAAERGTTLSAIINEALSETLTKPPSERAPNFKMTVFGSASTRHRHTPADFSEAVEADDRRGLGR